MVAYFLTARDSDASREPFFAAVVPQLVWLLKKGRQPEDLRKLAQLLNEGSQPEYLHTFRWLWWKAAERAEASGRYLLLVVDGLDEDQRPAERRGRSAADRAESGSMHGSWWQAVLIPAFPDAVDLSIRSGPHRWWNCP